MKPTSPNNFPLELVNEVLNRCQPKELFAIALTNSNYRIEAERVLYKSISLHINWTPESRNTARRCLLTLAKIQSKADMVKSFELLRLGGHLLSQIELGWLCSSLVAMKSLKHLKLDFSDQHHGDILSLLIPALKSCTFSLATIYIPPFLLDDWLLNQNQLKVFGMHDDVVSLSLIPRDRQFSICKQLSTQNSPSPTIFVIVPFHAPLTSLIVAFPIFSVNARWSAKGIADSLLWATPHRGRGAAGLQTMTTQPKAHDISCFKLHLGSLSEEGTLHDILTSLAEHFVNLKNIAFIINGSRIHLHSSLFSSLHKFTHLERISIKYYSGYSSLDNVTHALSHENCLDLARSWATHCPTLNEITFPDGLEVYRVDDGRWV